MISFFKVSNFKSIAEPLVLDFNCSAISEHQESNVHVLGQHCLLKSIVLYGHNASGKSKVLEALFFLQRFVKNSASEKIESSDLDLEPFRFIETYSKEPSYFEIGFYIAKVFYRYGIQLDKDRIHREWLLERTKVKEHLLFFREGDHFEIDLKRFENAEGLEKRTRLNASFLGVCALWNVSKAQVIDQWFSSIVNVNGADDKSYRNLTLELLNDEQSLRFVNEFMRLADLGIESVDAIDNGFDAKKTLITKHIKYNDLLEPVGHVSLLLDKSESQGTQKYFNLLGLFYKAINENLLLIIDEFDAKFHTLLSKAIIRLFNSEKVKTKTQLLIASHDTALLDRDLLRRDQVYFLEKDFSGMTKAISLVEYKHRKESPIDKNYLDGKFGGIPHIGNIETLFSDEK